MPTSDLYRVLQVVPDAEPEVIQAAYRALAKKYHPDTGRAGASDDRMRALNEAYAVLSDARRRAEYHRRWYAGLARDDAPAEAAGLARTIVLRPVAGLEMTLLQVPAGPFLMGSRNPRNGGVTRSDMPQHRVDLPDYFIGKYPITLSQFAAFVADSGYVTTAEQEGDALAWTDRGWVSVPGASWRYPQGVEGGRATADQPATAVSWDDACAFCVWMGQRLGLTVRLPSEAEWEKAARGADGRTWPWGNQPPDNTYLSLLPSTDGLLPAGHYSPQSDSPYGCADMVGAVWQWTHSIHRSYPYVVDDGREDANPCFEARVLRGGPLWSSTARVSVTYREPRYSVFRSSLTGFRVCATPTSQP